MSDTKRRALIVGATGLIGRACLEELEQEPAYGSVQVLVRRPLERTFAEKVRVHVADFERLEVEPALEPVDDAYCCLGTTMKVAGSREAFRKVDYGYVLGFARRARALGATRLALVSSIGADPAAWNFYLRVKGEAERDLRALGFECLELLRPSILDGARGEQRPGERAGLAMARAVAPWMVGGLRAYRPIEGRMVARAMVRALLAGEVGAHVRTYDELVRFAA